MKIKQLKQYLWSIDCNKKEIRLIIKAYKLRERVAYILDGLTLDEIIEDLNEYGQR